MCLSGVGSFMTPSKRKVIRSSFFKKVPLLKLRLDLRCLPKLASSVRMNLRLLLWPEKEKKRKELWKRLV